jgi:pseudaminic acid cytidylyltransferase
MTAVAIIPARGGSMRIPNKNRRMFHGKPIIAYSIETAKASGLFDRIIVTTDSEEIGEVAVLYGAEFWGRDAEYARDEVGTQEVMRHTLKAMRETYDYACCVYATAPLMTAEDLRDGYGCVRMRDFEYAMSVGAEPLRDAGQWYWGTAWAFSHAVALIGDCTAMVPIPEDRVCDVNTEDDWKRCEAMYTANHQLSTGEKIG